MITYPIQIYPVVGTNINSYTFFYVRRGYVYRVQKIVSTDFRSAMLKLINTFPNIVYLRFVYLNGSISKEDQMFFVDNYNLFIENGVASA